MSAVIDDVTPEEFNVIVRRPGLKLSDDEAEEFREAYTRIRRLMARLRAFESRRQAELVATYRPGPERTWTELYRLSTADAGRKMTAGTLLPVDLARGLPGSHRLLRRYA